MPHMLKKYENDEIIITRNGKVVEIGIKEPLDAGYVINVKHIELPELFNLLKGREVL